MRSVLVRLASIAAFATSVFAQFTINTPTNVVVCEPVLLSWSGGTPPYFLSILPGAEPNAAALENLGQQTSTSYSWLVNIAAGTSIGFTLRDSVGLTAQTAPVTILAGTVTTCVGQTPTTSAAGSTSGAATAPAPATTPATTPAATTPAPAATTPAPITTTTKPATTPGTTTAGGAATGAAKSGDAIRVAPIGAAGIFGAVAIALLA